MADDEKIFTDLDKVLKIFTDIGSNGGCIQECKQKDCEGESEECKAWDHCITITPNTPVTLEEVFGENIKKDTRFQITLSDVQFSFENAKINPKYIIRGN